MTTRLDSPVRRETSIVINGRLGNVTLVPADPARGLPEGLELQLKGTQQSRRIPLTVLFEAIWPQKATRARPPHAELGFDLAELEGEIACYKASP